MRSKVIIGLMTVLILICVSLTACNPDDPNKQQPDPDPVFVEMTTEQFKAASEEFAQLSSYMETPGYKLKVKINARDGEEYINLDMDALINTSDFSDVECSASVTADISSEQLTSLPFDLPKTIKADANIYVYNKMLYLDYKLDNEPVKRDSTAVNNDLSQLIAGMINSDDSSMPSLPDLPSGNLPSGNDQLQDRLNDMTEYFAAFTKIEYCEELKKYVVTVDYTAGATDKAKEEEVFGTSIDPFKFTISFNVNYNRIVNAEIVFDSSDAKVNMTLSEYNGSIEYPDTPALYEGTFFETLKDYYEAMNPSVEEFYGTWKAYEDGEDMPQCILTITENDISVTISDGAETKTEKLTIVALQSNILILLDEAGEQYMAMLMTNENLALTQILLTCPGERVFILDWAMPEGDLT